MALRRTIILADDHALMRAGIRALLDDIPDVEIIGETGDGLEALALVRRLQPDLILLDITLPGMNGLEVAERISKQAPSTRTLLVSMHAGPEYVARGRSAGAAGYLIKEAAFEELASALEAVFAGQEYLSQAIDRTVVEKFEELLAQGQSELSVLTPRQRQILQLIAEGEGTRAIAERLHVSVKTVETHRTQLMDRLGIHDVPGLVRFAIRMGLISPDA